MKIVEIHWLDACCEEHEATKKELLHKIKLVPRWHLGYVIEETETDVFIVPELNGWSLITDRDNDGKNAIRIPKGMIAESIRELGEGGLGEF